MNRVGIRLSTSSSRSWVRLVRCAMLMVMGGCWTTVSLAQAVTPPGRMPGKAADPRTRSEFARPYRENVTLPLDSNLLKRFGTIDDLLADRHWSEAIVQLQEIAQSENKSLVLVQPGKPGQSATYLNVATRCNVLLSRMPPDGRQIYRQKIDPQARRWFENWQRTRDEAELLKIVRQAFLSSYGDDALLALGEAAWDRGDFATAQACWERLVPLPGEISLDDYPMVLRYPDSNIDQAAILARIVLCSIMRLENERAEEELLQFAERFPEAEGRIGGQTGRYVDFLQKNLLESRKWTIPESTAEVATFGTTLERHQRIPESIDTGALRWTQSLIPNQLPQQPGRLPFQNECLSYHPVVYDTPLERFVIVNDADAIRAWNILTGEPAWKSENPDPSVIYPALPDEPSIITEKRCVGVPHYTLTIADDRLYARMGSPVTVSSSLELRREMPSDLVCLDLKQEGKLLWKVAAHELFPGGTSWRFEGTPVVFGGRAYVVLARRRPQLELMAACLDADDGRLIWHRPVGAFRASVDDSVNRISHLLLTVGGDRLFLSTDLGVILALDAREGRLEWAVSYESRVEELAVAPGETSRNGLTPALYHGGMLFVAPSDSNVAFCLEADSGRILWQYPYLKGGRRETDFKLLRERQWKHLLGVVPGGMAGHLIVSGSSLWAVDVASGKVVWSPGDSFLKRGPKGPFGRGLIAGDQVLIPMRESIEFFNVHSGELVRTFPLKTPDYAQLGGNLVLARGTLLVAQPNCLAAYGEYSQLKERIEEDLASHHKNSAALRVQLAQLEASEEKIDVAIGHYRDALQQLDPASRIYRTARARLFDQLQSTGSEEYRAGELSTAREKWREALPLADRRADRIELIFRLAQVDEALDEPVAAVDDLQQILSDVQFADSTADKNTAAARAREEISRLILHHGRGCYRNVETAADEEFALLTKLQDRPGLHHWMSRYPHSRLMEKARELLIRQHALANEIPEAFAMLSENRQLAPNERAGVDATLSILELLEKAGYSNSAEPLWRMLSGASQPMQVDFAGKSQLDLAALVESRLKEFDSRSAALPRQLERSWKSPLATGSRVVIPAGQSISPALACALVCFQPDSAVESWKWRCVDWRTGRIRWEVTADAPVAQAHWTPVQLLIATPHGWQARTAETGRAVWNRISTVNVAVKILHEVASGGIETAWPVTFDLNDGVKIFDPNDGHQLAGFRPPGRLSGPIGVGRLMTPGLLSGSSATESDAWAVVMQTLKPTRSWIAAAASVRDEWTLSEIPLGTETWNEAPLILKNRLISVTYGNTLSADQLEAVDHGSDNNGDTLLNHLSDSLDHWTFRNFAAAHAAPSLLPRHSELLVLVDSMQLWSFDPDKGSRRWSTGLTSQPMKNPAVQVACDQNSVYATADGVLRAVSIKDGSVLFERYLGNTAAQWRTSVVWSSPPGRSTARKNLYELTPPATVVAAWSDLRVDSDHYGISLCDGQTGLPLQHLQVLGHPAGIQVNSAGHGLLWTDRELVGLQFSSNAGVTADGSPSKD